MASLNLWTGIGNLGKDVEMRYLPDGKAVASFSVACSESWKDRNTGEKKESTEWVNVSAFGKLAEIMGEYLKKGSKVYISGKMKTDKYDKDGVTMYSTKIIAKDMIMLDSKGQSAEHMTSDQRDSQQQSQSQLLPTQQKEPFNDDLPF